MGTEVSRRVLVCVFPLVWVTGLATATGQDRRLVDAVAEQDAQAVRALLDEDIDVGTPRADGATALLWAAHWDDLDTVDLLLRAGADVNAADDHGVTPLERAAENASTAMVERLLAAGASANAVQTSGLTLLMTGARTGNVQVVNALLAHGADVNSATTETHSTALMWAVSERHPDIMRALLDAGADPRASTVKGFTPLMYAVRNGDIDSVETLIVAGVDVNKTSADDSHVLPFAIVSGQDQVAYFLLEQGADPNGSMGGRKRAACGGGQCRHLAGRMASAPGPGVAFLQSTGAAVSPRRDDFPWSRRFSSTEQIPTYGSGPGPCSRAISAIPRRALSSHSHAGPATSKGRRRSGSPPTRRTAAVSSAGSPRIGSTAVRRSFRSCWTRAPTST